MCESNSREAGGEARRGGSWGVAQEMIDAVHALGTQQLPDDLFGRRTVAAKVARSLRSVLGHPPTSPPPRYARGPFLSPRMRAERTQ